MLVEDTRKRDEKEVFCEKNTVYKHEISILLFFFDKRVLKRKRYDFCSKYKKLHHSLIFYCTVHMGKVQERKIREGTKLLLYIFDLS